MNKTGNNNITIREAREKDASLLLRFIKQLADYEKKLNQVSAGIEDLQTFIFQKRTARALIAEYGTRPAGFAVFFYTFSTFWGRPGIYLEDLFVLKEYRNKGIGRAILSHIAGIAIQESCGSVEFSVLKWNSDALKFYRKQGAEAKDEWAVYRIGKEGLTKLASESRLL